MQKIPTWPDPDLLIECKKLVYASAILHRPRRTQLFIPLTTTTATEIWWFCTNNHNKKFKFSLLKIGILLQFGAKLYLNCQSRPLFVYFRTFLITISIIQIEKSINGAHGIWTHVHDGMHRQNHLAMAAAWCKIVGCTLMHLINANNSNCAMLVSCKLL